MSHKFRNGGNYTAEGKLQIVVYSLKKLEWTANTFRKSVILQTALVFLVICTFKLDVLDQPPVWDTVFSVYSAAIQLAESGFDFSYFRTMSSYWEGGHASWHTPIALGTALVLTLVKNRPVQLATLHLIHFLIAAIGLVSFYRLTVRVTGESIAGMLTLAVLLQPIFLVQTGYLYLDMPLFTCCVLAISCWVRGRFWPVLAWSFIACLIKDTGVVVVLALAFAVLLERHRKSLPQRLVQASLLLIIPLPKRLFLQFFLNRSGLVFDMAHSDVPAMYWQYLRHNVERYLLTAPDLLFLLVVFVFVSLLLCRRLVSLIRNPGRPEARFRLASTLFCVCFIGFLYIAAPLIAGFFQPLTRHHVVVLPFLMFLCTYALLQWTSTKTTIYVLAVVCALFAVNRNGFMYPSIPAKFGNDFSITERSGEYRQMLRLQQRSIAELVALDPKVPVFYELPIHFYVDRPALGYVKSKLPNGHCIFFEEPYCRARLHDFPSRFYLLRISPWLGGRKIDFLVRAASVLPNFRVHTVWNGQEGRFTAILYRIDKTNVQGMTLP